MKNWVKNNKIECRWNVRKIIFKYSVINMKIMVLETRNVHYISVTLKRGYNRLNTIIIF